MAESEKVTPTDDAGGGPEADAGPVQDRASGDPNLGAAVGGYRSQRRPGWYMALVLLGVGLGALLALLAGEAPPPAEEPLEGAAGGAARPTGAEVRTGLVFGTTDEAAGSTPDMIAAGTRRVYCHFRLPEVDDIDALVGAWSRDGEPGGAIAAGSFSGKLEGGFAVGRVAIHAPKAEGFPKGIYEVEVTTGGGDVYEGSFIVVEAPERITGQKMPRAPGVQISEATICADVTGEGAPHTRSAVYPPDASRIYMAFEFASAAPGTAVRVRWLYAGQPIEAATRDIVLDSESGWAYAWISPDAKTPLLEGKYRVIVEAVPSGEGLASAEFEVRGGAR